jgi:hypothetical protein
MPMAPSGEMRFYAEAISLPERQSCHTFRIDTTAMPADAIARVIKERFE